MKLLTSIIAAVAFAAGLASAEQKVDIKCIAGLKFDVTEVKAKKGEKLTINFSNPDIMPHNLLIVKPGTEQKVATAAMSLGGEGMAKGWIPASEDIIAHSKLLQKDQSEVVEVTFTEAGTYPFICSFPGHSTIMKGTIIVE